MFIANHLSAPNDTNANPRRGWHVVELNATHSGPTSWWVEEEYSGFKGLSHWLTDMFGDWDIARLDVRLVGRYNITVHEYNAIRKSHNA